MDLHGLVFIVHHQDISVWYTKSYLQLYVDNERSRISQDGMYFGKVYSEMNRVKINKTFQGSGRLLAVNPLSFSSTFGIAGPVMA